MLTFEEMLLAHRALIKRGYKYVWYSGTPHNGYFLLARRYPPFSWKGMKETPICVRKPEELAQYLGEESA